MSFKEICENDVKLYQENDENKKTNEETEEKKNFKEKCEDYIKLYQEYDEKKKAYEETESKLKEIRKKFRLKEDTSNEDIENTLKAEEKRKYIEKENQRLDEEKRKLQKEQRELEKEKQNLQEDKQQQNRNAEENVWNKCVKRIRIILSVIVSILFFLVFKVEILSLAHSKYFRFGIIIVVTYIILVIMNFLKDKKIGKGSPVIVGSIAFIIFTILSYIRWGDWDDIPMVGSGLEFISEICSFLSIGFIVWTLSWIIKKEFFVKGIKEIEFLKRKVEERKEKDLYFDEKIKKINREIEKIDKVTEEKDKEIKIIEEMLKREELVIHGKDIEEIYKEERKLIKNNTNLKKEFKEKENSCKGKWRELIKKQEDILNAEKTEEDIESSIDLPQKLYLANWREKSEREEALYMKEFIYDKRPMCFLYDKCEEDKTPEVLYDFMYSVCTAFRLFNRSVELKLLDFIANGNNIKGDGKENDKEFGIKGIQITKKDKKESLFAELEKIMDENAEVESAERFNMDQTKIGKIDIQNIEDLRKYHIVNIIFSPMKNQKGQSNNDMKWDICTDCYKYGVIPIFYVEKEDWNEENNDFINKLKSKVTGNDIWYVKKEEKQGFRLELVEKKK